MTDSRLFWSRVVVVGASSGIGRAIATQLAEGGARVAALARREDELEKLAAEVGEGRITPVAHDVRDVDAVPALFARICADLGGLDLIVYATGIMPRIEPDQYDTALDRDVVEVNVTGAVAWLNEAGARFAEAGAGTIVGIGSIAGERGRRGYPVYGASKAALHSYLESLRNRLSTKGVTVVTAKPGFVDTVMTQNRPGIFWLISPEEASRQILAAAAARKSTVFVPPRWRAVSLAIKAMPSQLFRRVPI